MYLTPYGNDKFQNEFPYFNIVENTLNFKSFRAYPKFPDTIPY